MTGLLSGRTALVTGGGRGIGAGIAAALGRHGCAVAVNYLSRADDAERVADRIRADGGRALAVGADAADDAQAQAMVERIAVELGDVDVLVCNAAGDMTGVGRRIRDAAPVLQRADVIRAGVDHQLAVSLTTCRHVVPGMRRRGGGAIVMIGSTSSRVSNPRPEAVEIAVAKAAQDALARSLAADLGGAGIRVNVVAPGMVPTDAHAGSDVAAAAAAIERDTPTGRVSTPDDLGGVVVALASGLTGQVTGSVVTVDGGMTMTV